MVNLALESEKRFHIPIHDEQLRALDEYASLLTEWNSRINLTAVRDPAQIRIRHFLDSISCLTVMPAAPGRVIDVGSGAGFPGLVLKIMRPSIQLTLVESVAKKARFCQLVVDELGLTDVAVLASRVEDVGQHSDHREQYDWAVARALAGMPVLMEYLLPLVRVGGKVLAQKGSWGSDEADTASNALRILGGKMQAQKEIQLPDQPDLHLLLVINKIQATPKKYPRRPGIPSKRPL